jgi:hypothetical protein
MQGWRRDGTAGCVARADLVTPVVRDQAAIVAAQEDFISLETMKFAVLIYNDPGLVGAIPKAEFNETMRECLTNADELRTHGKLLDSQMLEDASTARSVRVRRGRTTIVDGPFAESKEVLGGFNIIEARDMDEAVKIAQEFPWSATGCVEVRPIRDIAGVRRAVGG